MLRCPNQRDLCSSQVTNTQRKMIVSTSFDYQCNGYWQCKTLFRLTGYDIIGEWKSSVQKIIKKLKKQENC
jgi:hypothetical protein